MRESVNAAALVAVHSSWKVTQKVNHLEVKARRRRSHFNGAELPSMIPPVNTSMHECVSSFINIGKG